MEHMQHHRKSEKPKMNSIMMIAAALIFHLFLDTVFLLLVQSTQPKPYMDEIFHIPQVQQYCNGNFTVWDSKITTLPGLYLITIGILRPLAAVLQLDIMHICVPLILRSVNVLFSCGNCYVIYSILKTIHIHKKVAELEFVLTAFTLSTFPILYFFTSMYYTDQGATFFILLMYLHALQDNHFMASLIGLVAVLFRQTSIVWVVFVAGISAGKTVIETLQIEKKDLNLDKASGVTVIKLTLKMINHNVVHKPTRFSKFLLAVFDIICWYALVMIAFIVFVYKNGGIVVGDRSNHQACLNFPQIFYFIGFTLFFSASHLISMQKMIDCLHYLQKNIISAVAFVVIAYQLIKQFTIVHEFLLADNRHYTFYIWSKIFRRHDYVKFALIPVYYYGAWSIYSQLKQKNIYWKIMFCVCLLVSTIPQKLMEFRYFIPAYLIFRMNIPLTNLKAVTLLTEFGVYFLVNMATIYLFVEKPFRWPNSDDLQRFMW